MDFHLHSICLFVDDYIAMVVKILPFPSKLGAGLEDRTLAANPSKPGNIFLMAMMIIFLHSRKIQDYFGSPLGSNNIFLLFNVITIFIKLFVIVFILYIVLTSINNAFNSLFPLI